MVNEMKNSSQIKGLPIISIADGIQIGKVKSLVINPDKGTIDFLTIDNEDWQISIKAIPFKKVIGIGEYAVTVEGENAVIDLNEIPITNQLVNKQIKITNTKVMTRKGELLGEVTEFFADENTGNILGMEIIIGERNVALPSNFVLTYGKDIIIVQEDSGMNFLEDPVELDPTYNKPAPQLEKEITSIVNGDEFIKEAAYTISPLEEDVDMLALKEKQVQLLKGKTLVKDILDAQGNILFNEGTVLTVDDIQKAQDEGPSILIELSMNVQA
jgi:uncharacterized protein YrrD